MMAIVVAGRVGSAFAAEIGTMKVTEQIDALYMLKTDPVEYLVLPRLIACCLMVPALSVMALLIGLGSGLLVGQSLYGIANSVFLDSVRGFLGVGDVLSGPVKGVVFGALIAIIGCNWGLTTDGGAKGVGQATTAAVVTMLLAIFVSNLLMTWICSKDLAIVRFYLDSNFSSKRSFSRHCSQSSTDTIFLYSWQVSYPPLLRCRVRVDS